MRRGRHGRRPTSWVAMRGSPSLCGSKPAACTGATSLCIMPARLGALGGCQMGSSARSSGGCGLASVFDRHQQPAGRERPPRRRPAEQRDQAAVPLRSCAAPANRSPWSGAMAGAIHGRGCRRANPRQDAQAWQANASRHRRAAGGRSDARPGTGRCNPPDRSDAGESGWREPALCNASWKRTDWAPHRVRTFKLVADPKFAAKLKDIVGLCVDPLAHAVVLSVWPHPVPKTLA